MNASSKPMSRVSNAPDTTREPCASTAATSIGADTRPPATATAERPAASAARNKAPMTRAVVRVVIRCGLMTAS